MTDRDRLTKRQGTNVYINKDTIPREDCEGKFGFHFCQYERKCRSIVQRKCPVLRVLDKLAYYEDLEEQGRLIVPPCKVGDKIYCITNLTHSIAETVVIGMWIADGTFSILTIHGVIVDDSIGKTTFFTKEEAEAKLKELNENG